MAALVQPAFPIPASIPDSAFARDVVTGLTSTPKRIPPKYFYDAEGSKLFEEITQLPEYYLTRCELEILQKNASEIAALLPDGAALLEFGSGPAHKIRILLDAASALAAYVPVDISAEFLQQEAEEIRAAYPKLVVAPVATDFTKPFALPPGVETLPRAGFFPGSTIGNFEPHEACAFLRHAAGILGKNAVLIIGADLVKDSRTLHAAYNDKAGITEKFNLNLITRINRELDGNIDPESFEHHAFFNRERQRIEMHLASHKRQKIRVAGATIDFRAGETIHTENSYKYSMQSFVALARGSGWSPVSVWTDPKNYFSVHALRVPG
jgi:dimethylhistidine N-methyltransferase